MVSKTQTPSILACDAHKSRRGSTDGTQAPSLLPQPSRVIAETLRWPRLCCGCCSHHGSCVLHLALKAILSRTRRTWAVEKKSSQRGFVRGFLFHSPTFLDHPLTGGLPCISQPPQIPDASNRLKKTVFLPGEHGPLHHDCNTIFAFSGCECYSAKPCLKTSFIIYRLQTEIIFDNLCRKQAAFWLLASRLKGRKHMFTVRPSPWRKH